MDQWDPPCEGKGDFFVVLGKKQEMGPFIEGRVPLVVASSECIEKDLRQ
jgi:hypothetical protein